MTPKEIDEMQAGNELDVLVAKEMGQTDFKHLSFQYMEGVTEDGKDGWDGFYCPRCHSSSTLDDCTKPYSSGYSYIRELLKWILNNSGDLFIEYWQDNEWFICNLAQPIRMLPHHKKDVIVASSNKVADDELPNLPLALCRFVLKVALAQKEG